MESYNVHTLDELTLDSTFDERAAVPVSWEAASDLIDWYEDNPPKWHWYELAWTLRHTFGDDGEDLFRRAALSWDAPEIGDCIDEIWDEVGRRGFTQFDMCLIDAMNAARWQGWQAPADVQAAFDRLAADELAVEQAERTLARVRIQLHYEKLMSTALPAGTPGPSNAANTQGMPLLETQATIVDLGQPIVSGFLAGQQGRPSPAAPTLPAAMQAHPLFEQLNQSIGHVIAVAERGATSFRPAAAVDMLAVLAAVHEETFKIVVARIRGSGCALPEGKLCTAVKSFENKVSHEVRSGAGWRTNAKGEPDPQNANNVAVFLRLIGVRTRFNVWRQRAEVCSPDGDWTPFTDAELNRLRGIASQDEHRFRPTKEFFRDMLLDHARHTSFDPVLDWIDSVQWDGQPRLVIWLTRACGVPCDPYHQAIGKNVIGGIVKRARHPGAKHDETMILIGGQGNGKSTLTKILALEPEWHSDSVTFEGRPQDIVPQLFGKLVVELSELEGVHRRDVGYIKRFLSTQTDNFTAKYEAFASDHARRCIFIGTCNLENPLVDDTGNRRFYPVRIPDDKGIDLDWLRANIAQLIAEAAHLEAAGETFGIPREVWGTAAAVQESARTISAVEELLTQWFTKPIPAGCAGLYVLSSDIVGALTIARQNANAKIGNVMQRLGFVHRRLYIGGVQQRAWIKSTDGDVDGCIRLAPAQTASGFVEMRLAGTA